MPGLRNALTLAFNLLALTVESHPFLLKLSSGLLVRLNEVAPSSRILLDEFPGSIRDLRALFGDNLRLLGRMLVLPCLELVGPFRIAKQMAVIRFTAANHNDHEENWQKN